MSVGLYSANTLAIERYGPVQTYAQSPFHTNSLSPQLRSGFGLSANTIELYGTGTIASIWAETSDYQLDYYQNQIALGGKWQINEQWQLDLHYRWNYAGNNHLDTLTTHFHDWFGIDQNGRDMVDDHNFNIYIPEYGIELSDFRGETLSHGYTAYLQYQLVEQTHHGLSLGMALYFNDAEHGIFSSTKFEQALQLNYGYRHQKHQLDAILSITHRKTPSVFEQLPYRSTTWSTGASYQYAIAERHEAIVQFMVYEGTSNGDDEFSKPSTEFTLAYRYRMDQSAIEFSIIENVFYADNSTDIAFTLGYRYRFDGGF
ncbi:DUF3187 family protein [Vibrio sinensis]|uniref:DUF3187 family protein n=1 Tax=Vibrio sinensis TaxID=2302434 RepID=A0A3A6R7H9_9VIBR|nr:DUF3187 family protein [Vibrio sinensis]RJX72992.1 DUF3187 family protein [Vibrio sinensis]